jgi:hypothetical protein
MTSESEAGTNWSAFIQALRAAVPSAERYLDADKELFGDEWEPPDTPGMWWATVGLEVLADDLLASDADSFWPELFGFVEVASEVRARLSKADRDADVTHLDSFLAAGVICDVTRRSETLERLLPLMGRYAVMAAHYEVGYHDRVHEDWGGQDIDWRSGGASTRR